MQATIRELMTNAGIKNISRAVQTLRHTKGVGLGLRGATEWEIQQALGYADVWDARKYKSEASNELRRQLGASFRGLRRVGDEAALDRKDRFGYLRTYGNNYIRYVPYFQLGVALHGAGDCAAALASFDQSETRGETADVPDLNAQLQGLRDDCKIRLAPPAIEPADTTPGSASTRSTRSA